MKIKRSSFVTSAVKIEQYPDTELSEIAFVGRSNVGKSSLINMLLNRNGLAKTSSTPGKTRLVNFFDIDGKFTLVDLPGYGYAKVSKSQKGEWKTIIDTYLSNRKNLIEVVLLVDSRHEPTDDDKEMYNWIKMYGYNGIVIATKADKLSKTKLEKSVRSISKSLGMDSRGFIIPVSSETRFGKYDVWDAFNELFKVNNYDVYFERQDNKNVVENDLICNDDVQKVEKPLNKKNRRRNDPEYKQKMKLKKQKEARKNRKKVKK